MSAIDRRRNRLDNRGPSAEPEKSSGGGSRKRRKKIKYKLIELGAGFDMPLFFLVIILLAIGLVTLFSASYAKCYFEYNDSYYFISRQAMFAVGGILLMLLVSAFDYHHYHKFAWPLFFVTVLILTIMILPFVKDTALVPNKNGAYRWIKLGIEFQPSEIAKMSLILLLAHMVSQKGNEMASFKKGFVPAIGVLGLFVLLIVLEKHMSATLIVAMIGVILMFIGGVRLRYLIPTGIIAGGAAIAVIMFSESYGHSASRVEGWFDWESVYQTKQSLFAIGSGQLLGVGLGQSRQKYMYLPEPQNDFIFAIYCEEMGFIGALILIVLFALLIWRGIYISLRAKDKFGMMIGIGITFQIGLQIVLNICVVTNTIPNTGISLPFFSYGGTALIILLFEMGILLQISRSSNIEKT